MFKRIEAERGEQFGWELGFEQSAGVVNHIKCASSKMIVRIYGVEQFHALNGLCDNSHCPNKSPVCCAKFAR